MAHFAAVALYQDAAEDVTGYALSKQSDAFAEEEGEQEHLLVGAGRSFFLYFLL